MMAEPKITHNESTLLKEKMRKLIAAMPTRMTSVKAPWASRSVVAASNPALATVEALIAPLIRGSWA
jgi:hypothetical protein